MKKTILAVAIPAAMMMNSAFAVELYNDGKNTMSIGGHASAQIANYAEGEKEGTRVEDNSARINFGFTRDLGNGWTAEAKAEYSMTFVDGNGNVFGNRLGYIGLSNEQFGTIRAGQQWGVYYDVAGATDMPIIFGNDYLYSGNDDLYSADDLGLARADAALTYRKGFDLGNAGALNFGLQWQGKDEKLDERMAVAISYNVAGFGLGYALSTGDDLDGVAQDISTINVKYGTWGKGFYGAINFTTADEYYLVESEAVDAVVSYTLPSKLNLAVSYEILEHKAFGLTETEAETVAVIAEYPVVPTFVVYGGYESDLEDSAGINDVDYSKAVVGARVYF